jgi:hypothetical protein
MPARFFILNRNPAVASASGGVPLLFVFRPYVRKETFMYRARFPECLFVSGMKKPPEGGFYL